MAVGHLKIRRYEINIRPENFRPMIFQWFGEAADLIVGQMLCPRCISPLVCSFKKQSQQNLDFSDCYRVLSP